MRHLITVLVFMCALSDVQTARRPWIHLDFKLTIEGAMQLTWDTLSFLCSNIWGDKEPTGNFANITNLLFSIGISIHDLLS